MEPCGAVREWLAQLRRRDAKGHIKCVARIKRLAALGRELRRPEADYLQDGVYEHRARSGHVNYRIPYVIHGRDAVVLVDALTKEDVVLESAIRRAVLRSSVLAKNPGIHLHEEL
jgi:putative component of toxin-antitoxin plasmid stabilization module